ncbi:hypothetical protein [Methanosarcina lacustris]|nr:hypothetical protein [Methanosarcina lacustris]
MGILRADEHLLYSKPDLNKYIDANVLQELCKDCRPKKRDRRRQQRTYQYRLMSLGISGNSVRSLKEHLQQLLYRRGGLEMSSHTTIGKILVADNLSEYEKDLVDRYFQVMYREEGPNQQLANEMFQKFDSLVVLRFGNVVFTRGGI